jgi:uncharacterized protein involved in exopolysaccharide biosynthesis
MALKSNDEQIKKTHQTDPPVKEEHLLDFLIIFSKHWRFIFSFTLGAAFLTTIAVFFIPNQFTASTLVLPPSQNSSVSSALMGQLGGSGALASVAGASLGIKSPGDIYISLFRSRTVEDSLIQRFDLMSRYHKKRLSDTRQALVSHSSVTLGTKDGLIYISVTDRDPGMAAEMANGYVDEFKKLSANLAVTEASQRRLFFQQQLLSANEKLAGAEEEMKRTEKSTGVLQIDSQAKSLIESAAILRGQVSAKEVQLQAMRSYATENNPEMVVVEQELVGLKGQLAGLSGTAENPASDIIMPKGNIPESGIEYIRKLRDMKYYETISELLAKQFEIAKMDEARQGAIVQVADVAVPPDKKSSPHRTLITLLVALVAFLLATFWTIFAEACSKVRQNPIMLQELRTFRASFK